MGIISRYKLKTGEEVAYFPPIQNTDNPYLTEAAMHADQANQLEGYGYLVDGVGAFTYLGTVAGTASDYEGFGANLRLSNLAGDLTTTEQDGIKTKIGVFDIKYTYITNDTFTNNNYDILNVSGYPSFYAFGNADIVNPQTITIKNGTKCPHILLNARAFTEGSNLRIVSESNVTIEKSAYHTNRISEGGIVKLTLSSYIDLGGGNTSSEYVMSGDLIKNYDLFESPNGTLYKVGVDDTGARTSIAL